MKRFRHSKYILIILIIVIMTGAVDLGKVQASPDNLNHKSFSLGSDVSLKGVFSSHSFYFEVDKYTKPKSLYADIFLNISQLVNDQANATITFSMNGTSFSSSKLIYKASEETQNIKVSIPANLIKEGLNEFKTETYSRLSDDPCKDDINNGNWIILQGKSNIAMDFTDKDSTNNISEFTYPFVKLNEDNKINTVIAIPDNYNQEELAAAFMLQAYLGKATTDGDYTGIVVKYSSIPNDKNIIYIGGINNLPEKFKPVYSNVSNENYSENAIIKKVASPFNEKNKLMTILSENGDMLTKAVKLLMNKNLVSQLNVDTFKVDKTTKVESDLSEEKVNVTFKDLGLDGMQLKGPYRQSVSLGYVLPKNRILSNGAKIKLYTRYSQNLDFNRSLLTVYVNGTPIGSKKLDKAACNGDQLELPIPKDISISSYMDIKVAFDLEVVNLNCQFRQEEMPWALITGESYIYIPNNKADFYKFDSYPQPFISDNQFNNVGVVVPENLSENEIEGLSKIFSYLGKDVNYNNGNLKVIEEKNFSADYHNMNLIVYGTPEKNKVIKDLNSSLWFKYSDDYNSFTGNEKLYLTEPYASNISSFQFDVSPYNKGKAILFLTSTKEDLLIKSLTFLSSSKQVSKLTGDSVLIDNYGNIKTFKFKKDTVASIAKNLTTIDTNTKIFISFIGLFFIFSIISIVMYSLKNRKFKSPRPRKRPRGRHSIR